MPTVATLITDPRLHALDPSLAERIAAMFGGTVTWLANRIACDIVFSGVHDNVTMDSAIRADIGAAPVDVVVQEAATRRKSILVADMDSTMIAQECIDELAAEAGLKDHVAAITARAMNGEIAFEPALRERVALLRGLATSVIDRVISTRIAFVSGGRELVATMRANGGYAALLSGGFTAFTGPVAQVLGFDENRGNVLVEQDGVLAGTVLEPILGRQAKVEALEEISARLGLTPADAIAVGDGANDLAMLARAGSGVALHAKPAVAAQARMRVDHGDLTALLYIQGYRQSEFRT